MGKVRNLVTVKRGKAQSTTNQAWETRTNTNIVLETQGIKTQSIVISSAMRLYTKVKFRLAVTNIGKCAHGTRISVMQIPFITLFKNCKLMYPMLQL